MLAPLLCPLLACWSCAGEGHLSSCRWRLQMPTLRSILRAPPPTNMPNHTYPCLLLQPDHRLVVDRPLADRVRSQLLLAVLWALLVASVSVAFASRVRVLWAGQAEPSNVSCCAGIAQRRAALLHV